MRFRVILESESRECLHLDHCTTIEEIKGAFIARNAMAEDPLTIIDVIEAPAPNVTPSPQP